MAAHGTAAASYLALAALAAGCGGPSHTSAPTTPPATTAPATTAAPTTVAVTAAPTTAPAPAPTTAAPASTAPAGPRPCSTADLQLALTDPQGAAGSTFVTLSLLDRGPTCTVQGYPGVSYVTGPSGAQVGAAATRSPGTAAVITLDPGHAAQSTLRLIDPGDLDPAQCQLVATSGLRVYPPGQTAAAFVSDPGQACSNAQLAQPTLYVGPLVAGPAAGGIAAG